MNEKQVVEITVAKDGTYTFKALEGFSGENCRNQTKQLEMVLGGEMVSSKNTNDYYDGDGGDINVNLKL